MSESTQTNSVKFNANIAGLEQLLDDTVNKKQPLQLPTNVRKWLADNVWWMSLAGGVLSLWGAWSFWQVGHYLSGVSTYLNELARVSGTTAYSADLGVMWYVALIGLVIEGILLLLATSKLKQGSKSGWNLLFYTSLVSLAVGLVYLFVPGYGFGGLLGTLVGTAVGWFFLFQIRSRFTKA
ncbi:MAG TPA: hypothetical protein PK096_01015 [Candidatus Saccharibacteria bacterium]|nr:hypothetical protein [Candidatus Saccharibacteria bacterium]HRK93930.1 hypothetical protein [Candidatus Saccharibacteria bacterium]